MCCVGAKNSAEVAPSFFLPRRHTFAFFTLGRYPEDHGIMGNYMYDLKNARIFNASDHQTTQMAEWWKDATPFWSTAAKHGKKIAFYNWHDCKLPGAALENPNDCRPYTPIQTGAPSKSKIAREFDEAFTKLYKNGYHATVVKKRKKWNFFPARKSSYEFST